MDSTVRHVTCETNKASLVAAEPTPLVVQLSWASKTPAMVTMKIRDARSRNGRVIEWEFARDLLADGGGTGDVEVLWDGAEVLVTLTNGKVATIAIPTDVVLDLLESVAAISPPDAAPSWVVGDTVPKAWLKGAR